MDGRYDRLMQEVCVKLGWCGCIKDGRPLHVDDFIPAEGVVTAEQFADRVIRADNLNPALYPDDHRKIRAAFVKHMGEEIVGAHGLQWKARGE